MSVLIKGMEMPKKTYAYCMLIKDIDGSVQLYVCTKNSEEMSEWEKYDLLPVPPHGRLIDADALVKVLKRCSEDDWNKEAIPFSWSYAYECEIDVVDGMPTIIEAEVNE